MRSDVLINLLFIVLSTAFGSHKPIIGDVLHHVLPQGSSGNNLFHANARQVDFTRHHECISCFPTIRGGSIGGSDDMSYPRSPAAEPMLGKDRELIHLTIDLKWLWYKLTNKRTYINIARKLLSSLSRITRFSDKNLQMKHIAVNILAYIRLVNENSVIRLFQGSIAQAEAYAISKGQFILLYIEDGNSQLPNIASIRYRNAFANEALGNFINEKFIFYGGATEHSQHKKLAKSLGATTSEKYPLFAVVAPSDPFSKDDNKIPEIIDIPVHLEPHEVTPESLYKFLHRTLETHGGFIENNHDNIINEELDATAVSVDINSSTSNSIDPRPWVAAIENGGGVVRSDDKEESQSQRGAISSPSESSAVPPTQEKGNGGASQQQRQQQQYYHQLNMIEEDGDDDDDNSSTFVSANNDVDTDRKTSNNKNNKSVGIPPRQSRRGRYNRNNGDDDNIIGTYPPAAVPVVIDPSNKKSTVTISVITPSGMRMEQIFSSSESLKAVEAWGHRCRILSEDGSEEFFIHKPMIRFKAVNLNRTLRELHLPHEVQLVIEKRSRLDKLGGKKSSSTGGAPGPPV